MLSRKGFTLIELVVILLIIGILATFVAQKIGDVTSMKAAAFTKKLRADVRYAQNVAMTRNRRARVYFNGTGGSPNPGYAVAVDGSDTASCSPLLPPCCNVFTVVDNPDRSGALAVALATGDYLGITVTITYPTAPTTTCLEFNSLGTPFDCKANLGNCSSPELPELMSITVPAASAAVGTMTVAIGTGAVN